MCIGDAPFISYTIVPVGFAPVDQSATLVIRSADGNEVGTETVDSFTGQIIWPGASIDQAGNATDWPGWRQADDGVSWEPDPTDDLLRDGLTIEVIVDGAPSAIATVEYPPDDPPAPTRRSHLRRTRRHHDGVRARPVDDDNPADDCELATAGSDPSNLVLISATILLAGLAAFAATRRRGAPAPGAG